MIKIDNLYLKKRIPEISHLNLDIPSREIYVLLSSDDVASNHLINILSGLEKDFKGRVEIDGMDIISASRECGKRIAFLETGGLWPPDMTVGQLVSFMKNHLRIPEDEFEELYIKLDLEHVYHRRISSLEEVKRREVLFALTRFKQGTNYIIRNFARGMPLEFNLEFRKHLHRLKAGGTSILYFSDDVFFASEIGDRVGFMKKGKLVLELKASSLKKVSLKELYFQFLAER
jgi:ABC-type multidrug transport system ATPase subunit